MQCFNHQDRSAVGICKHCQRGICKECASDLEHGLACKGVHEEAVTLLHELISTNSKVQKIIPQNLWVAPAFYLFMGLMFVGWGAVSSRASTFFIMFGAGFIVFAAFTYFANRKAYGKPSAGA